MNQEWPAILFYSQDKKQFGKADQMTWNFEIEDIYEFLKKFYPEQIYEVTEAHLLEFLMRDIPEEERNELLHQKNTKETENLAKEKLAFETIHQNRRRVSKNEL